MTDTTTDLTLLAYQQSQETAEESTRCLLAAFAYLGVPDSLIDLGCGNGHLVRIAGGLGVQSFGVDLHVKESLSLGTSEWYCERFDLTKPLSPMEMALMFSHAPYPMADRKMSMALCWEVAEHLPPDAGPTLCDTAVSVLAPGGTLLWTAATPGQGGAGHVNERSHAYWRHMLVDRGLRYQSGLTDRLRRVWADVASRAYWYAVNLLVFRKPTEEDESLG